MQTELVIIANKKNKITDYLYCFKDKQLSCFNGEYQNVFDKIKNNNSKFFIYTDILDCVCEIAYYLRKFNKKGLIVYNSEYFDDFLITDIDKNYSETYFIEPKKFSLIGHNANIELIKSCYLYVKTEKKSIYDAVNFLKMLKI